MNKLNLGLVALTALGLFACTQTPAPQASKIGYLKTDISQAELNNQADFKRYSYYCTDFATGGTSYLATYFPLSRESRRPENFGIYFQLDGGKAQPFDHLANIPLNAAGTKFEVRYRSYQSIDGGYVELTAREFSSVYRKNGLPWLECREG